MRTKVVYTIICSGDNLYLAQARISAFSLKYYNPSANLVVVLDKETMNYIKTADTDFQKYVDDFIVVDVPAAYSPMQRSRYIKTRLRSLVTGNYLYMDTDTVVAGNLEEIDSYPYDIAAVFDSNRPFLIGDSDYVSDWYINSNAEKLGWESLVGCPNYNGGVLFVKDTPAAHNFYNQWHELWLECVSKGLDIDMPALCRANKDCGFCIKELPGKWNCQIQRNGLSFVSEALIIHCFTGGNLSCYSLCEENLLKSLNNERTLSNEIKNMIKNARGAFYDSTTILPSSETAILGTAMARLYKSHYGCFRILNFIARMIMTFSGKVI